MNHKQQQQQPFHSFVITQEKLTKKTTDATLAHTIQLAKCFIQPGTFGELHTHFNNNTYVGNGGSVRFVWILDTIYVSSPLLSGQLS